MSIYEDLLNDFFNELAEDESIPSEIIANLREKLKNGQIKSNDIINLIKMGV
ncbi:MAG: hypothetical protein ACC609_01365 [Methanobacterium formicicum]